MQKLFVALFLTAFTSLAAFAQTSEYKKSEFYVGYSNGQVDTGIDSGDSTIDFFRERETYNGVNVSGVYNVSRFVGIKGDFSATFNSKRFAGEVGGIGGPATVSVKNDNSLYNFLGGVQIKDNSKEGRFKPFVHALVGAAHARAKISDYTCSPTLNCGITSYPDTSFGETGLAGAFGGGLDIRVNDKVQIRAFQVDYNPIRIDGNTQNNIRLGVGLVF